MKKSLILIATGILFATFVAPAYATEHKQKYSYNGHFGDMDLDGNDGVNWDEFKKHFTHAENDVFKTADGNNDGSIDHDEWHEFKDAHGYGHADGHKE